MRCLLGAILGPRREAPRAEYAAAVAELVVSAEQVRAIAAWSDVGADFLPLRVHTTRPRFARSWDHGDILVTQGDAHIHVGGNGLVNEAVPPLLAESN